MFKIRYFNSKFPKIAKRWRIITKSSFKKISYDTISVTSSLLRHQLTSQDFYFGPLPIKISGYASDCNVI